MWLRRSGQVGGGCCGSLLWLVFNLFQWTLWSIWVVWLDGLFSFDKQVSLVAKQAFFYLCQTHQLFHYLLKSDLSTVSHTMVTSRQITAIHSMQCCLWRCFRNFRLYRIQLPGCWLIHWSLRTSSPFCGNGANFQSVSRSNSRCW